MNPVMSSLFSCKDEKKLVLAHQTYLELTEVDGLTDVKIKYDEELELVYIVVDNIDVFVPVHSSFILTPSWIHNIQNKLCSNEPKSFILVIRETDSTFVRHRLTAAILPTQVDCKKVS